MENKETRYLQPEISSDLQTLLDEHVKYHLKSLGCYSALRGHPHHNHPPEAWAPEEGAVESWETFGSSH